MEEVEEGITEYETDFSTLDGLVSKVKSGNLDLSENPNIRLQLFDLSLRLLCGVQSGRVTNEGRMKICDEALIMVLDAPEVSDTPYALHYPFIADSTLCNRFIDPRNLISGFRYAFYDLAALFGHVSDDKIRLILEDILLVASCKTAEMFYHGRIQKAFEQISERMIIAMKIVDDLRLYRVMYSSQRDFYLIWT